MRWLTPIVLVILCLAVASILYHNHPQQGKASRPPEISQPERLGRATQKELPPLLRDHPALASLSEERNNACADKTTAKFLATVRPDLQSLSSKWLAPGDAASEERDFFEKGFRLLRSGSYREGREALQTLINIFPDTKLAAPAYWAIGLFYYQEGGTEHLLEALDQFKNFMIFFGNGRPDEFAEAAQIDIAVINIQLMNFTQAATALEMFVARWPSSPYAPAASRPA